MPRWPSQTNKTAAERFWPKVDRRGPDECWLWKGGKKNPGRKRPADTVVKEPYGVFAIEVVNKRTTMTTAHRAAWILAHGRKPPADMDVCHTCDNRLCVNPAHLWLGSRKDNMADCKRKGRHRYRSATPRNPNNGRFTQAICASWARSQDQ